jgi:hypothetical protein
LDNDEIKKITFDIKKVPHSTPDWQPEKESTVKTGLTSSPAQAQE